MQKVLKNIENIIKSNYLISNILTTHDKIFFKCYIKCIRLFFASI